MPDADWPDTVPVLVADDVLVSDERDEEGDRRTLSRWASLSFTVPAQRDEAAETLTRTISAALGRRKPAGYFELNCPGDGVDADPRATPALMARAWNAAMRELGYNAPDPKPKKTPKRVKPKDVDFFED